MCVRARSRCTGRGGGQARMGEEGRPGKGEDQGRGKTREGGRPGKGRSFIFCPICFCTRWNSALTFALLRDFFLPGRTRSSSARDQDLDQGGSGV